MEKIHVYLVTSPRLVNNRVEALKKTVNNIYDRLRKASNIKKKESAFKGFLTSYNIKGEEKTNPKLFLENNKDKIVEKIKQHEKPAKMNFLLERKQS